MSAYFNIHDVLADGTIEPGTSVELPLWLCKALVVKELVTVKRPTFLGERIQRRLTAGAACENLRARCPYFYSATKDFCMLDPEKDVELSTVIFNAYRERYYKLAGIVLGDDQSEGVNDFKQKLSQEELHLFEGAVAAAHHVQAWKFDHQVNIAGSVP